jgi:hypothetical protein
MYIHINSLMHVYLSNCNNIYYYFTSILWKFIKVSTCYTNIKFKIYHIYHNNNNNISNNCVYNVNERNNQNYVYYVKWGYVCNFSVKIAPKSFC